MNNPLGLHNSHVLQDGQFVNVKVQQVVMAIKEYEPLIDVVWLPEGARQTESGDVLPAFKIIYRDPNGPDFTLFHVKNEDEFDLKVLARIIQNDQRKNPGHTLSDLEAFEQAQKRVEHQAWLDRMEEANDIAFSVFRSHLNTYKVNDNLIVKEGTPYNAAREHSPKHLI